MTRTYSLQAGRSTGENRQVVETLDLVVPEAPPAEIVIQRASIILTDDQIKALPSAAIQLVPAPGTGKALLAISAFLTLDATAGAYTNITNASFVIGYQQDASPALISIYASVVLPVETYLGSAVKSFLCLTGGSDKLGTGDFSAYVVGHTAGDLALAENMPLALKDDFDGVSDYTGGNTANSMRATLVYAIVDL